MRGFAMKEFFEFSVNQKYIFWIKYLYRNLPIRMNQSELVLGITMKDFTKVPATQKYLSD